MNTTWKLLLGTLLALSISTHAANEHTNGGDIVNCKPEADSKFSGYYFLDYLLTYDYSNDNADLLSGDDTLTTIQTALNDKLPKLGKDFRYFLRDFKAQVFSKPDLSRPYVWTAVRLGLQPIDDQFIFQKVPPNCQSLTHPGQVDTIQAVLREERPLSVFFQYDDLQLHALQHKSELQLAMLIVHEWLWQYSANANVLRDANRYLFSEAFQTDAKELAERKLLVIGLDLEREGKRPLPDVVEYKITDCDPEKLPVLNLTAPRDVGVTIHFTNLTQCGFEIFHFDPTAPDQMDITIYESIYKPGEGNTQIKKNFWPYSGLFEVALKPFRVKKNTVIIRISPEP